MNREERREAEREAEWRKTKQGEFESSMLSLDQIGEDARDPSKVAAFSDRGAGVERIMRDIDGDANVPSFRQRCIDAARKKIIRRNPKLLRVFYLVLKNGTNRKESIWELAARPSGNGNAHRCTISATSKG